MLDQGVKNKELLVLFKKNLKKKRKNNYRNTRVTMPNYVFKRINYIFLFSFTQKQIINNMTIWYNVEIFIIIIIQ